MKPSGQRPVFDEIDDDEMSIRQYDVTSGCFVGGRAHGGRDMVVI